MEQDRCDGELVGLREPDSDLYSVGSAIDRREAGELQKAAKVERVKFKDQTGFTLSELLVAAGLSLAVIRHRFMESFPFADPYDQGTRRPNGSA